jgi:hypothetical protein
MSQVFTIKITDQRPEAPASNELRSLLNGEFTIDDLLGANDSLQIELTIEDTEQDSNGGRNVPVSWRTSDPRDLQKLLGEPIR